MKYSPNQSAINFDKIMFRRMCTSSFFAALAVAIFLSLHASESEVMISRDLLSVICGFCGVGISMWFYLDWRSIKKFFTPRVTFWSEYALRILTDVDRQIKKVHYITYENIEVIMPTFKQVLIEELPTHMQHIMSVMQNATDYDSTEFKRVHSHLLAVQEFYIKILTTLVDLSTYSQDDLFGKFSELSSVTSQQWKVLKEAEIT